jgi:folate-binding protein YgfZ
VDCAPLGADRNHVAVRLNIPSDVSSSAASDARPSTASESAAAPVAGRVVRRSLYGFPGVEFLVPRADLPRVWRALAAAVARHGGTPIGYATLNALRLEAGVKWIGTDFDDHQIPHEAGLEGTHISFTKGCYTGQEIVERVRSRGHVNRRLTGLAFGGSEPPQHGAALTVAPTASTAAPAASSTAATNAPTTGADAGLVTSAAFSPLLGRTIGMGYVRREYVAQQLQCGSIAGEVLEFPLPGALPVPTA